MGSALRSCAISLFGCTIACGLSTSSALMSLHFLLWDWLYLSAIFIIYLLLWCMCVSHSKYARVCVYRFHVNAHRGQRTSWSFPLLLSGLDLRLGSSLNWSSTYAGCLERSRPPPAQTLMLGWWIFKRFLGICTELLCFITQYGVSPKPLNSILKVLLFSYVAVWMNCPM